MPPDDEIVVPQDNLYVITWETDSDDFESGRRDETHELPSERAESTNNAADIAEQPDQILTNVVLRFTERAANEKNLPDQNDDMIVENQSPRGGK